MAEEEHERLMQEKRERIAAQQQATLEAEIAVEELRLPPARGSREARRPLQQGTSRDRQRRRDAVAARSMAEGCPIEEKRPGWTSLLLEAAGRDRPVGPLKGEARRRIRIEMLPPSWGER